MANLGNYQAAVDLFTQAINLDAKDFRFVTTKQCLLVLCLCITIMLQTLCKYHLCVNSKL